METSEGIPLVPFGKYKITRLIVGSNPIYGYSHFNELFSKHMRDYHTPDRTMQLLHYCVKMGINTFQSNASDRSKSDVRRFREEDGRLHWICLGRPTWTDEPEKIVEAARLQPIAMSHHGWAVEQARRKGDFTPVKDTLRRIRDTGVMTGFSVHDPDVLRRSEDEGWDVDFYITSMYHMFRPESEVKQVLGDVPLGEVYLRSDPPRMCEVVRQTRKPCLAIKVLAAGRLTDSESQKQTAFRFALNNTKPTDAIIIGMYQRFADQVAESIGFVRSVCGT